MHFYADHDNEDGDNNNDIGVCMLSLSVVSDSFATPCTIAHQPPLSLGFSRYEYWSGLSFPFLGVFLIQGLNPGLLHGRQILDYLSHQGSPTFIHE